MSLLLDARKKSQQTSSAQDTDILSSASGLSLEDLPDRTSRDTHHPVDHARSAGQNLFDAKVHSPLGTRASINRNLLIALGATFVLLAGGGSYVWYEISGDSQPLLKYTPPSHMIAQPAPAVTTPPQTDLVAGIAPEKVDAPLPAPIPAPKLAQSAEQPVKKASIRPRKQTPVRIKQNQTVSIDAVLNDAYQAYLAGRFDQAQPLYQKALKLDARNTDALLGLAAIAQQDGADNIAAHYYAMVLELDPRDPVANAGMSALTTEGNTESRLKHLLREQQDSSALHFALGNQYAGQARWADAQQSYFNAYKLDPGNVQLAFNLGVSLDRLGQRKVAAQFYQRALELDPQKRGGFDHAQISLRIEELTN